MDGGSGEGIRLDAIEARLLGCLIEKKRSLPTSIPLTLNALQVAANQKTSRDPVMALKSPRSARASSGWRKKGWCGASSARGSSATSTGWRRRWVSPARRRCCSSPPAARPADLQRAHDAQRAHGEFRDAGCPARRTRPPDRSQAAAGGASRSRARPEGGALCASPEWPSRRRQHRFGIGVTPCDTRAGRSAGRAHQASWKSALLRSSEDPGAGTAG